MAVEDDGPRPAADLGHDVIAREIYVKRVEARYEPGKLSSMSPGSLEDWPISQQRPLFSLFGDVEAKIGVKLTKLTKDQAEYIGVPVEGPFKAPHYRY